MAYTFSGSRYVTSGVEVNGRAYMIDDVDHITLLLAEEY